MFLSRMTTNITNCDEFGSGFIILGEVITGILCFIGLTNLFLIFIIILNKSLRANIHLYVINMCFTSIMFLCTIILDAIYIYYDDYIFGENVLSFHTWLFEAILFSNVISLLVITYERYIAVFHPLKYKSSVKHTGIKIILIWILSGLLAIPFIFTYHLVDSGCETQVIKI